MVDVASLQIKVSSSGTAKVNRELDTLSRKGHKAERATDGLTASSGRLRGMAMGAATAVSAMVVAFAALSAKKLVDITREFDILNAQLRTATGSSDNAAEAFSHIQDFAAETPYDIAQVTDSFVKLVNYGLTPSKEALTAYGDTASAMGKDLNQMIEAVADAATGEFERLKEFGIKAKNQGDTIAFTFRGVTTEVANNAKAIEEHLIQLGQNNFADAMTERMNSLDGALSNFGDSWDTLFREISAQGVGSVIEDGVRMATAAIDDLTAAVASGQLEAQISALGGKFDGFGEDVAATLDIISNLMDDVAGYWGGSVEDAVDFMIDAVMYLPENIRAAVQLATVEMAALVDKARALATNLFDGDERARQFAIVDRARAQSIDAILAEREAAINSYDEQMEKADSLRDKYDEAQAARKKATEGTDPLAKFGITPTATGGEGTTEDSAAAKRAKQSAKDFAALQDSLRTEEEAIKDSYQRRLQIIEENTKPGSALREKLSRKIQEERDEELTALREHERSKVEALKESFMSEEELLKQDFERKREIILENTAITEQERINLMERLQQDYNARQQALEQERMSMVLSTSSTMYGELASIAKTFAGEQSGIYKTLFAMSKAFAIADATIKVTQAIANAAASTTWPANLAAMASVASSTAGLISTIAGTNFSGAYDKGGYIPSGSVGVVGEYGPELVRGPANVTSRKETAKQAREAASGGRGITMHNTFVLNSEAQADQFRKSERQIEASLSRALRRAT